MGQVQSQAALFRLVGREESLPTGGPWVIQLSAVTASLSLHVYVYPTLQPSSEQQPRGPGILQLPSETHPSLPFL